MSQVLSFLGSFDGFTVLLALLFFLDYLAFQPLWSVWFWDRLKPFWLLAVLALACPLSETKLVGTIFLWGVFRYYFIEQRWSRVRRGGGAPGFMAHWAMLHLSLIQIARLLDSSGSLAQTSLWVARTDFAVIMICAGVYKYAVGYMHRDGMEYGRVNPLWGYHWRFFLGKNPYGFYPQLMNRLACLVEVCGGILMLLPGGFSWLGAAMISLSFVYVSLFIRLGRLAWLMAVLPLLFHPNLAASLAHGGAHEQASLAVAGLWKSLAWGYVCLLPLVKLTQYANLFANWRWPEPLQSLLDRYANTVPIIMWRVFTPDVTNFYVRVYDGRGQALIDESPYSVSNWSRPLFKLRMLHVCESIALTSVFTTLRYFPSRPELFERRLLEYSKSLGDFDHLRYEIVAIRKEEGCFRREAVERVQVDLRRHTVERQRLVSDYDFSSPSTYSPVREATHPGSYVAWRPL